MEAAYDIAARLAGGATAPPSQTVLGFRLKPFTLGHLFILEELECQLLAGGATWELADLLIAAFVCARPWRESRRNLRAWWRQIFFSIWGAALWRREKHFEALKFRVYLETYQALPLIDPSKHEGREMAAPLSWRLFAFGMADLGLSPDEVKDLTLVELNALWAADGERKGDLRLATPAQIEFRRRILEQRTEDTFHRGGAENAEGQEKEGNEPDGSVSDKDSTNSANVCTEIGGS